MDDSFRPLNTGGPGIAPALCIFYGHLVLSGFGVLYGLVFGSASPHQRARAPATGAIHSGFQASVDLGNSGICDDIAQSSLCFKSRIDGYSSGGRVVAQNGYDSRFSGTR